MIGKATLTAAISIALLAGCEPSFDISEDQRHAECIARGEAIPDGHRVRLVIDGREGTVFKTKYRRFTHSRYFTRENMCEVYRVQVRIAVQQIGLDGGNWDTASPEAYPVVDFRPFEIEAVQ